MPVSSILIVGASAAGLAAAETLRKEGYDRSITLVGDEPHLPYDRPPLSKHYLCGQRSVEELALSPSIASLNIDLVLGERAVALDRRRHEVTLASSRKLLFDAVIVATGIAPRRLRGGSGLLGVHTLRTLDDACSSPPRTQSR